MVNDFVTKESWPLFTSGSRFSIANVLLKSGLKDAVATFDLVVRELPRTRNFLVFGGLEHAAEYLLNIHPTDAQLKWLAKAYGSTRQTVDYFKQLRFSGDMYAMPEGTIAFQSEPLIRITAPLIEAQLVEMNLINTVYLQTILASKFARISSAANGKELALGFNRSYGSDAAMKATRWSKIFNIKTTLAAYDFLHKDIPPFAIGTFHYLIMAFENEREAFRAYLKHTDGRGYVLVDTYDTIAGIKRFIQAAKELEREDLKATGIQLDSGDLYKLSVQARTLLDQADLAYVKIFAMANLDEWKIQALEARGAPIDVYAGVTEILTPADAPTLELVYKLSELRFGRKTYPKMKTSAKKMSLPGVKQVYRVARSGRYAHDVVGLDKDSIQGSRLLVPIIQSGRRVYQYPTLADIGRYYHSQLKGFSKNIFSLRKRVRYPVHISPALQSLTKQTREVIRRG